MSLPKLSLVLLPQEHAILRLPPDAPFPDWTGAEGQGSLFLTRATQVKNIWVPYGE